MRFVMLLKATKDSEAGVMPSAELITQMMNYNGELVKAGVLLDAAGLQPSSKGARVRFSGANRTVVDGPFAETKELVAGFWIIQAKSKAEAIELAKRFPPPMGDADAEIELRQLFEAEDFPDAPAEVLEHERKLRESAPRR
jgi:hypothetical protein